MSNTISSGCKKDLMVIQFANSLIQISKDDEANQDKDILSRKSNKDYKLNKRIDRHLEAMTNKLGETINAIFEIGGHETAAWIRKNLDKRIGGTLTHIQQSTINLEMLAMYVLYVNFAETERPLHKAFKWLEDAEQYFKTTDLMSSTIISRLENPMFLSAYDVVKRIKN